MLVELEFYGDDFGVGCAVARGCADLYGLGGFHSYEGDVVVVCVG